MKFSELAVAAQQSPFVILQGDSYFILVVRLFTGSSYNVTGNTNAIFGVICVEL